MTRIRPAHIICCAVGFLTLTGCINLQLSIAFPRSPESPFGLHGPQYSHWLAERKPHVWREGDVRLTVLADTGAGWARQDFWWSLVEPTPGEFQWDDFDRAIDSYVQHNVKPLVILCYGSAWSHGAAPTTDEERAAFANYVYQMVARYHDRVGAWEIWNEPNIMPYWTPRPDPELYTKLLREAYAAAKRADPNCVILGGVLAGPDDQFLAGMYAAGAAGNFDVLSYHNYGQENTLETEAPAVARLRAVMAQYGEADKPIWQTENGFYTGPAGLSDPEQARRLVKYSLGLLALGLQRTFQLTLIDWTDDPDHADKSVYRGITHADYTPKPSYAAYKTMCERIAGKSFVGLLRPASDVDGLLFRDCRESVLVLWRVSGDANEPLEIDLGVPTVLTQTLHGAWQQRSSGNGRYTLPIGVDPLYIINPGAAITAQEAVTWPTLLASTLPRSADATLDVTVAAPRASGDAIFTIEHAERPEIRASVTIPADTTRTLHLPLNTATLDPGTHAFVWTLTPGVFSDCPKLRGYRQVAITPPLTLSFAPLTQLDPARPQLTAEVAYTGSAPTTADVTLRIANTVVDRQTDVQLTPGQTAAVPLALDPAALATSDARLRVTLDAAGLHLETGATKPLIRAPHAPANATLDGKLDEWRDLPPQVTPDRLQWEYTNATPAADDLQVSVWIAWDARGIWLAVHTRDDQIALPTDRNVWNGDSLQVGLDLAADARPDQPFDNNDLEIELGGNPDSPWCYLGWCPAGWPHEALSSQLQGAVRVDPDQHTIDYELLIPATLIESVTPLTPDAVLGFSLLVNDNDGAGREGWQELTPGIGMGKRPAEFAWLWLQPAAD